MNTPTNSEALPPTTGSVSSDWQQDAVIIMECFAGCVESGILPSKCSQLRKLIDKTLAASGQRTTPVRRVPKRAAMGKAHDGMVTALQVIHTWASVHDGIGLAPASVIRLTEKALAEEKSARINTSPQNAQAMAAADEKSQPKEPNV